MSEAIDRVLDVLGGKLATVCADGCGVEIVNDYFDEIRPVLERELKPLLEAGQAMQERLAVLSDEVGASEAVSSMAWRAALTSEERPAERGSNEQS